MGSNLDFFKGSVMTLVIVAIVIAAGALALDAFQGDLDTNNACVNESATYNTTSRGCDGGGGQNQTTEAFNATQEGLTGAANATSYLSTIGTLLGVAALIAVVIGAFYLVRR